MRIFKLYSLVLISLWLIPAISSAQGLTADATLSSGMTSVGRPVVLNIQISGSGDIRPLAMPAVDGLDFRFVGNQRQFTLNNLQITATTLFQYQVVATREGNFTIPPLQVEVEGTTLTTRALTLEVGGAPSGIQIPPMSPQLGQTPPSQIPADETLQDDGAASQPIYAELIVPKASAYVGELVPIEVRFYFSDQIRVMPQQPPILTGEGFTSNKFTQPTQAEQIIRGRRYVVVSFRSAISGVRPGNIEIGPVEQLLLVQSRSRRVDPFMQDDFFQNFFRGQGSPFTQQEEKTVKTQPVSLEIKALPTQDRPASFNGAVGQFTLENNATPARGEVGEPFTVQSRISGRGNFDKVSGPVFSEAPEWRTYPPTSQFAGGDEVSFTGTKTFEQIFTAQAATQSLPAGEFSWFDPVTEKYEIAPIPARPVEVIGGRVLPAPTPAIASAAPTPAVEPEVTEPASNDLAPLAASPLPWTGAPYPIIDRPGYLLAQGVPLILLLAGLGFAVVQRRNAAKERLESTRLTRELDQHWERIRDSSTHESETLLAASLWISTLLRKTRDLPSHEDPRPLVDEICEEQPELRDAIRDLLGRHNQLRYSGASEDRALGSDARKKIVDTLNALKRQVENSK